LGEIRFDAVGSGPVLTRKSNLFFGGERELFGIRRWLDMCCVRHEQVMDILYNHENKNLRIGKILKIVDRLI